MKNSNKKRGAEELSFSQIRTIDAIAQKLERGKDYTVEVTEEPMYTKADIGKVMLCVCTKGTIIWVQVYDETDPECRKNSVFQSKDMERITEKYNEHARRIIEEGRAKL
jgi:hypothetical protein